MSDLEAVKAEGRRLLAKATADQREWGSHAYLDLVFWLKANADVLLAPDVVPCCHPSSTGIDQTDGPEKVWRCDACGWLHVDTLGSDGITRSAPPPDRVPEGWRVKWAVPLGLDPYPYLVPTDTEGEQP